ncbi:MAG: transketolase [Bacteroidetes bacterium RIFOXYA12_FULL_35_11]|nr:MAG: transketolase [Bacteroidetes bacterium GWF2_35_48]OFY76041.1 MAG: transketolase [Bacteroidetes bacterium RIFOXYA12_FULL_35_11]OFY97501.1 MAG: transketolase [Bacteroidetes bacterium RIFOXYB2_FULL_35_7]HBX51463.1 transketolase [Bacteroidales bacterium]
MNFKNKGNKPTKTGFGEGLASAGEKYKNIIGIGADITASVGMNFFAEKFPERFFSFGIAEQNIAGVAAGFALSGKIPFFSTYGVFAALRTTDQLRVSICYNNLPVKIGGAHAGISVGPDGATHQALEDIAIMRVLPDMTVLSPCDADQAFLATIASVEQVSGPCYIRFGREAVPNFTGVETKFIAGKGQVFLPGKDAAIIATGHLVWSAIEAALELAKEGFSVRVVNIHTIKPIDEELLVKTAMETGAVVTAEEHQITGGLGSAVAEILVKHYPVPMEFIGMKDCFGESGTPDELLEKYEMKPKHIIQAVKKVLNRKLT